MLTYSKSEYIRCKYDALYFICNYITLKNNNTVSSLRLNDRQLEIANIILTDHNVEIPKHRQEGATTLLEAFSAWMLMFYSCINIGVATHNINSAERFVQNVEEMIERCPLWCQPGFSRCNKEKISLNNESSLLNLNSRYLRGIRIKLAACIVDENSNIENLNILLCSMTPKPDYMVHVYTPEYKMHNNYKYNLLTEISST